MLTFRHTISVQDKINKTGQVHSYSEAMKRFIGYIKEYIRETNKTVFLLTTLLTAVFVFINYRYGLNDAIYRFNEWGELFGWFLVFLACLSLVYGLQFLFNGSRHFRDRGFWLLLLVAPALFAWKMSYDLRVPFSARNSFNLYLNQVFYWPFKLLVLTTVITFISRIQAPGEPVYGLQRQGFKARPYLFMLLMMIPLVALAATQPDFLQTYPKLKAIHYLSGSEHSGWYELLFELSYGTDFFSIELFFRGFMVLAFARYAGKDAILPMAVFYCAIHFGKPLGECISSFFGGLLLGILTYHTRNIWGGLMVHLGIAWLMEWAGYLGNQ